MRNKNIVVSPKQSKSLKTIFFKMYQIDDDRFSSIDKQLKNIVNYEHDLKSIMKQIDFFKVLTKMRYSERPTRQRFYFPKQSLLSAVLTGYRADEGGPATGALFSKHLEQNVLPIGDL